MIGSFVYVVTRIQNSNPGETVIPNLGVHMCPALALRHFESVVRDRAGEGIKVEYDDKPIGVLDKCVVIGIYHHRVFGKENEEIRLEKWRVPR